MKNITLFGRQLYLETLTKRTKALKEGYRQNIAIIGDEMVGKTSLIYTFLKNFNDPYTLPIYLEVKPEPLDAFAKRFIGTLLYNFLSNSGIPLKEDLEFLLDKSQRFCPKTVAKISALILGLKRRRRNNTFTELLSLCDSLHQESGKFCVVILDEFHNLTSLGSKNIFGEWSRLLMLQKSTMYIIISSMKFRAKAILAKNLSLLFGNFELIAVEPFDTKASEEYIIERLGVSCAEKGMRDFMIHFTGGFPFYLELLSDALQKNKAHELTDTLEGLLFNPNGLLHQKFYNYLKRFLDLPQSNDYICILHEVASGNNKIDNITHLLHKPKKDVLSRINALLEADTLMRSGDFLKLNDRVFGFWLRFVYQNKTQSLTFDQQNQKDIFRNSINSMIQEFVINSKKPLSERTADLLSVFEDEIIQIENKKLRLDRFREIKPVEFSNKHMRQGLIGRSSDSLWIMAFKHERLSEDDITEFSKECKKYHSKLQRKIIITTGEIDANARLRALEEKIWTWDLNNLNQILDAFCQPRVIA